MTLPPWALSLVPPPLLHAALNLLMALICGALIGSERQIRQRMAGLRTNAPVALGSASFVGSPVPSRRGEPDPRRRAGRLGDRLPGGGDHPPRRLHGARPQHGGHAPVPARLGMMAGAGAWPHAALLTGFVVFVDRGLRPLVKWIKRHTLAGQPLLRQFRVVVTSDPARGRGADIPPADPCGRWPSPVRNRRPPLDRGRDGRHPVHHHGRGRDPARARAGHRAPRGRAGARPRRMAPDRRGLWPTSRSTR